MSAKTPEAKLLVVDDEPNIRELLSTSLRFAGFEVIAAANGREALAAVEAGEPDLAVLDVMLPDMDGFTITRKLRAAGRHFPVLFLTARDDTTDKVTGLTVGGDDYVTKPFSLDEVVARIRAVLRRTHTGEEENATIAVADLELDDDAHEVRRAGEIIDLSPTEFKLLRYLMMNEPGAVQVADPGPCVGVRLQRGRLHRGVLHLLPAPQGRPSRVAGTDPDQARRRLPDAHPGPPLMTQFATADL